MSVWINLYLIACFESVSILGVKSCRPMKSLPYIPKFVSWWVRVSHWYQTTYDIPDWLIPVLMKFRLSEMLDSVFLVSHWCEDDFHARRTRRSLIPLLCQQTLA
jgi:hypothetical protein